jgi:hypothetical protein
MHSPAHSPFRDPEFLRTVQYIPFDPATDTEARRQDQAQAAYMFDRAQEREKSVRACRAILGALLFSIASLAAIFGLACL